MVAVKIAVDHHQPLSVWYNSDKKINFGESPYGDIKLPSITAAYWFIIICQHELRHGTHSSGSLVKQFLEHPRLPWVVGEIPEWLKRRGVEVNGPAQLKVSGEIYYSILVRLIEMHQSGDETAFSNDFFSCLDNYPKTQLEFLLCRRKNNVLAAGISTTTAIKYGCKSSCASVDSESDYAASSNNDEIMINGANAFGRLLTKLAVEVRGNRLNRSWRLHHMVTNTIIPSMPDGQEMVLVLSNSYMKHILNVSSGLVIRQPGATIRSIAQFLRQADPPLNFSNFENIILLIGYNEASSGHEDEWEAAWEELRVIIDPEIHRRGPNSHQFLVSYGCIHPNCRDLMIKFSNWLKRKLSTYLHPPSLATWKNGCALLSDGGLKTDNRYFDNEKLSKKKRFPIHVNHAGTSVLWNEWSTYLPGLEYVSFDLAGGKQYVDSTAAVTVHKGEALRIPSPPPDRTPRYRPRKAKPNSIQETIEKPEQWEPSLPINQQPKRLQSSVGWVSTRAETGSSARRSIDHHHHRHHHLQTNSNRDYYQPHHSYDSGRYHPYNSGAYESNRYRLGDYGQSSSGDNRYGDAQQRHFGHYHRADQRGGGGGGDHRNVVRRERDYGGYGYGFGDGH